MREIEKRRKVGREGKKKGGKEGKKEGVREFRKEGTKLDWKEARKGGSEEGGIEKLFGNIGEFHVQIIMQIL